MKNTTVLAGRMFLDTQFVASSGSRMVKQAFEGAAVINTDLPKHNIDRWVCSKIPRVVNWMAMVTLVLQNNGYWCRIS